MKDQLDSLGIPYKVAVSLAKWDEGKDPENDVPDEVVTDSEWYENGEVVTDPQRIEELESSITEDTHGTDDTSRISIR